MAPSQTLLVLMASRAVGTAGSHGEGLLLLQAFLIFAVWKTARFHPSPSQAGDKNLLKVKHIPKSLHRQQPLSFHQSCGNNSGN